MAKKTKPAPPSKQGGFLESLRTSAVKEFGSSEGVFSGSVEDMASHEYGIPLPGNLPLQYLFGRTVLPLERIIGLVGKESSLKSSLAYELFRYCALAGGFGQLIETENKVTIQQIKGFAGEEHMDRFHMTKVGEDITMAMEAVSWALKHYQENSNREFPELIIWDSLAARQGPDAMKKMRAEGKSQRSHPEMALLLTPFLEYLDAQILSWPVSIIYTNHDKEEIDSKRPAHLAKKLKQPGGAAQRFLASYILRCKIIKSPPDINYASRKEISITVDKSTTSSIGKRVDVDVWWYHGPRAAEFDRPMFMDWDSALTKLILAEPDGTDVRDIVHITGAGQDIKCKRYEGVVGYTPLGKAIHADTEIREQLQDYFGILPIKEFRYGS